MKAMIVGYGRMGKMLEDAALAAGMEVGAIIDIDNLGDLKSIDEKYDVVFDFSAPGALEAVSEFIKRTGSGYLCGCTGHTQEQKESIKALAQYAPVVHAANYSLGVAAVKKALELITPVLGDLFDIEIMETHHNQKIDAPSGTAYLFADAIDPEHKLERVYDRHAVTGKRGQKELGMVSRRGGNMAGEHVIAFFGEDETVELTHRATSRRIFVNGAIKAAQSLRGRPNGFYTVEQLLF